MHKYCFSCALFSCFLLFVFLFFCVFFLSHRKKRSFCFSFFFLFFFFLLQCKAFPSQPTFFVYHALQVIVLAMLLFPYLNRVTGPLVEAATQRFALNSFVSESKNLHCRKSGHFIGRNVNKKKKNKKLTTCLLGDGWLALSLKKQKYVFVFFWFCFFSCYCSAGSVILCGVLWDSYSLGSLVPLDRCRSIATASNPLIRTFSRKGKESCPRATISTTVSNLYLGFCISLFFVCLFVCLLCCVVLCFFFSREDRSRGNLGWSSRSRSSEASAISTYTSVRLCCFCALCLHILFFSSLNQSNLVWFFLFAVSNGPVSLCDWLRFYPTTAC